ncbi:MAG: ABC transporter ATP-binding protein [Geodermatophilaceae bacterium]|nr:ABC transporter ATP-binding protein [Geodermatophilaceae bacterium]MDQ3466173.1 ABC transporter ATP-binding protein/permease [Actinomycetota bacterium]
MSATSTRADGRHRIPDVHGAARRELIDSLRTRRPQVRGLVGWSLLEAVPALLSGLVVARAVDDGFLAGRPGTGLAWLAVLGVTVLIGAWGTRQTLARLADLVEPFRDDMVRRVVSSAVRRPVMTGRSGTSADVARLTQHVEIVREAYAAVLTAVQQFLVVTLSALIGLLTLAPALLPLVLPPLVVGLALFAVALPRMAGRQRAAILADERLAEDATTVGSGLRDIVACGGEDVMTVTAGRNIDEQAAATVALSRLTAIGTVAVAIGGWLPVLLVLAVGPNLLGQGVTAGVILGAIAYTLQALQPALQSLVEGLSGPGLWLLVTMRRIVETADRPAPDVPGLTVGGLEGRPDLVIESATFAYSPWAAPVIEDLDLDIPAGDHIAIVGPSGVGKSTLAGLMTGLLHPQQGEIRLGGIPSSHLGPATLAAHRVFIPQEAYLFSATVRENLMYLSPDAVPADLAEAVDRLGAGGLIERLGGYDAELEPDRLSAGEGQLITLVRAYLSPARLVLLDEATCHLDPAAEAAVERAFADRPGTLVVIAHRMSSALRARRILVMDGAHARLGDHEELLLHSPLYRDLVGHWHGRGPGPHPGPGCAAPGTAPG